MKKAILFLSFSVVFQFAFLKAEAQFIKTDLKIVGPGGEVLIYYRDGNDIVVRNCGTDYPDIKKRSDCKTVGQENRVPVGSFKAALKSLFLISDADKVKPINKDDIDAFKAQKSPDELAPVKAREKELSAKLDRIKTFINDYGVDTKSQKDKADTETLLAQVRNDLTAVESRDSAVKKINKVINDIVDIKIGSTDITSVSVGKNSDQAMYSLLKQFDASRVECGTDEILNGTIDQPEDPHPNPSRRTASVEDDKIAKRIANCSPITGSIKKTKSGGLFSLVSRKRDKATGKIYEVWKDTKTGLLWGDRLDKTYTHYAAVDLDSSGKVVREKACTSDEAKRADAGISEKSFALPTIEEYQQAEKNGVREVLPNMNDWFWSASLYPNATGSARFFGGYNVGVGFYGYFRNNYYISVRCVGR